VRILWLCYFSNKEIQDIISPRKRVKECCPYIPTTISLLESADDIELHVISPHEYITGVKKFKLRNVRYYFYNAHMPFSGRHWPLIFKWDYISNFFSNKLITRRIVNKIKPDLIHLHGAEMAFYSSTIFQFISKYPSILTVQGFINKSTVKKDFLVNKRIRTEKKIFERMENSFYRTQTMANDIKKMNPQINLYWNTYPKKFSAISKDTKKEFDIVFFAKVTRDKGIADLLEAVSIIKRNKPNISLCVIGSGHLDVYKRKSTELGISKNISWKGYLPTQDDVHKLVTTARISVLPTYNDIISGTIIESIFLRIPVVAYNVGSIHELNSDDTLVSLVDKHDIKQLASEIEFLLDNPSICQERAEKAYTRVSELYVNSDSEIRQSLLSAYSDVIITHSKSPNTEGCRKSNI
jgi:glycosyltransferase involved in cell wall biosynthesis